MIFDGNLLFDGTYSTTSGLTGVNVFTSSSSQVSTNTIDLLNARDMGDAPKGNLRLLVLVTTAFAGGTSLNVQFQGSTDNATWTTYAETGTVATASLTKGVAIFDQPIPAVQPNNGAFPRYYRLNYICAGAMTAGAVISGILTTDMQAYYPPGVVVSN